MKKVTILLFIFSTLFINKAQAVRLFDNWDRITCKILTEDSLGKNSVGTGFILRYKDTIYMVTNHHVFNPQKSSIFIRPKDELRELILKHPTLKTKISNDTLMPIPVIIENPIFFEHPTLDIVIVQLQYSNIFNFAVIGESKIGCDSMIEPGREIYFLGYPNDFSGESATVPLVRGGLIAGLKDKNILLDGNFFGGSSGSPIFLDIDLENHIHDYALIGIVSDQLTIPIEKNKEIKENMGMGIGIKISSIIETIEMLKK